MKRFRNNRRGMGFMARRSFRCYYCRALLCKGEGFRAKGWKGTICLACRTLCRKATVKHGLNEADFAKRERVNAAKANCERDGRCARRAAVPPGEQPG